jgi:hypothetical protein
VERNGAEAAFGFAACRAADAMKVAHAGYEGKHLAIEFRKKETDSAMPAAS